MKMKSYYEVLCRDKKGNGKAFNFFNYPHVFRISEARLLKKQWQRTEPKSTQFEYFIVKVQEVK